MLTVHGVHHIGLTVPNMEQAIDFFETMFGGITVVEIHNVDLDDDFMRRRLGVTAGRKIKEQAVVVCGNGGNIELFEYSGEKYSPVKHNSEIGGFHIAFEVDDANVAAERLRKSGVDVLDGPTLIEAGPLEGLTWVYLRAPWGQYLECVSIKGPLGYEKDGSPKMWSPVA